MANFSLTLASVLLFFGIILLSWGADILVTGAANIAKRFGLPSILIGLTIIAIGTSLPEIVISITAALKGNPELAIGNAIGSNIANIGLVLGVTALIVPLQMRSPTLRRELPLLFLVMLLTGTLMLNGILSRFDSAILLIIAIAVLFWLIQQGLKRKRTQDELAAEFQKEIPKKINMLLSVFQLIGGLIILPISSRVIVDNAVLIARYFNVSNLIIGLTIIAIGTSLPELATAIAGALKKEYDIVIGNVIGSNIFNLLVVLAIPAMFKSISIPIYVLYRDFSFMIGITIVLYIVSFGLKGSQKTTRFEGGLLLGIYVAYLVVLYFFK